MASTSNTDHEPDVPQAEEICPICQGIGYLRANVPVGHPEFGKLNPCSCQLARLATRRANSLRALSNIETYARMTFDTFAPEGHGLPSDRRANLRWAYQEARDFSKNPQGWLILRGGYGCGKTHLAAAIANACVERGQAVLFVTVPDLLDHLRAAYAPTSTSDYDTRFNQVQTASVLILDDLGTESSTPWAQEKLFQIFNYRYNAHLPTVITTNRNLEEIALRLRSRLVDPDLARIVSISAPDYRLSGISQDQSDLSTLSLHEHQVFESLDLRKGELSAEDEDNITGALKVSRDFAENPSGWLAFTGGYGVGKTHLAAAIANQRMKVGQPALFIVVPDLLDHLRATFNPQSIVTFDQRFEELRRAPLLILDDLGTESATPWAREKLYQIFDYRYNARLPTVITTAKQIEDLDPRLASRMLDVSLCTLFAIMIPPYRGGSPSKKKKPRRRR